jgi:hypothetical protein
MIFRRNTLFFELIEKTEIICKKNDTTGKYSKFKTLVLLYSNGFNNLGV